MGYTSEYQIGETKRAFEEGVDHLYQDKKDNHWIRRYGMTTDSKEPYYEVSAKWILNNVNLNQISFMPRTSSYNRGRYKHNGENPSTRGVSEKLQAKALVNYCTDHRDYKGVSFVDYEMPLCDTDESGNGEVDVLGLSNDKTILYLMELKNVKSNETLLRSALEIYTYYSHLGLSSKEHRAHTIERFKTEYGFYKLTEIIPCILFFEGSKQHNYFKNTSNAPSLMKLIKQYSINVFMACRREKGQHLPFTSNKDCCLFDPGDKRPILNIANNQELFVDRLM